MEIVIESVIADLGRITRSNGFWSDVGTGRVYLPDWDPESDQVMAIEAPSLQVWAMETSLADDSANGMPRVWLEVWIVGTVKGDREVQKKLARLNEDIHAVMFWNQSRNHPQITEPNSWCHSTSYDGCSFMVERADQSKAQGALLSKWRFSVNTPRPNG